eukprot:936409-Pleurochrysis_carterae.AAC.3
MHLSCTGAPLPRPCTSPRRCVRTFVRSFVRRARPNVCVGECVWWTCVRAYGHRRAHANACFVNVCACVHLSASATDRLHTSASVRSAARTQHALRACGSYSGKSESARSNVSAMACGGTAGGTSTGIGQRFLKSSWSHVPHDAAHLSFMYAGLFVHSPAAVHAAQLPLLRRITPRRPVATTKKLHTSAALH